MSAADDEREGMPRAALRAISASLFSRSRAEDRGIRRGAVARIHVVEEREIEAAAPALQGVVAIVFTLQVFSLFFLVNPSVGEYVLLAVFGYVVLSALIFALAATGLGLAAALIHGLRAEGSRRQAFAGGLAVLAGVLAVLLSVDVPVAIVWHLFGS